MKAKKRKIKEVKPIFDLSHAIQYCIFTVVFAGIIYGVREIVLNAISASPTGKVGNSYLTLFEVHNTGAAFNLFSDKPDLILFSSLIAVAVLAFIGIIFSGKLKYSIMSSMALLSAGILMNFLERVTMGHVIDYINCEFAPNFPVFNTADIMIVCGALGLIVSLFTKD